MPIKFRTACSSWSLMEVIQQWSPERVGWLKKMLKLQFRTPITTWLPVNNNSAYFDIM